MNRRIVSFTILICLVIIIACAISAVVYNSNKTVPAIASQVSLKNQKSATETASSIAATIAFEQTQTAIPTTTPFPSPTASPTSPPEQTTCEATILQGNTRVVYPVPGQGSSFFSETLTPGTKVAILGRLADRGWEKIKTEDLQGWIREDSLTNVNDCQPTIYDLHYLQSWLASGERLILEDTFSFGSPWVDDDGNALFIRTAPDGEAYLEVPVDETKLFFPKTAHMNELSAFKIYTSTTLNGVSQNSFIGIRFRENDSRYFQAEFFPGDCHLDVYNTDTLIYSNSLDRRICIDRYYDMSIALSQNNRFDIQINGFDPVSIDLEDADGNLTQGDVKLIAQNVGLQLHYFVVTAP